MMLTSKWLHPRFFCAAALICGVFTASFANADPPTAPPGDARVGIQSAYDGINTAFSQHDLTRTMSYFAPDYRVVDEKGATFNKDQTRRQYEEQLGQIKTEQSRYVIQSVTPTPEGTRVEMKLHMDGTGEKRVLFLKVKGTFTDDLWVRDLWVNTPQGWRLKSRQTLQDEMRIHH